MPFSYVASVREHFGAGVVERLSRGLGETPSAISRGLDVSIPRVVAGVVAQGETESGARSLLAALEEGHFDGAQLGQMAGMLDGGPASTQLAERGQALFPVVLGARQQEVIGEVARSADMRTASARSLLGLVAPLTLGVLGRRIHEERLDVEGVRHLLAEVGHPAAPAGVDVVDAGAGPPLRTRRVVGEPGTAAAEVPPHRPDAVAPRTRLQPRRIEPVEVRQRLPLGRWLLPAALALLLVLGWSLMRGGRMRQEAPGSAPVATAPVAQPQRAVPGAPAPGDDASGRMLPDGTPLKAAPGSALAELVTTLENARTGTGGSGMPTGLDSQRFAFQELSFNQNSARLDPEARATVAELARVLEAYPDARIRMEGHASAEIEEDPLALSQARAEAVREALETQGISGSRLEAVGHGASDPIAQDRDEEGRRRNTRTDVILIGHRGR